MKTIVAWVILLLFTLYGINSTRFERSFYLNEILSFIGFLFFLNTFYKKQRNIIICVPFSGIYKGVLILILLGGFHLLVSLVTKTNFYYYLRNSVIVYSIFSFFLGFYIYTYQSAFFKHFRKLLWIYISYFLVLPSYSFLERFTTAAFFPFLVRRYSLLSLIVIIVLNVILAIRYESLTVIIITCIVIIIINLRRFIYFKIAVLTVMLGAVGFFAYLSPSLALYKKGDYHLFGQNGMHLVINDNRILALDYNTTWRAVFWYRLIVEQFPENILGIGMGTPLINYKPNANTADDPTNNFNDEHDAHVTGGHNTFITLFVRLGIIYLAILLYIYWIVFAEFYNYRQYYISQNQYLLFISFFTVSAIGLFNLLLETPTAASLYWILLGFIAKTIHQRKIAFRNSMVSLNEPAQSILLPPAKV